MIGHITNDSGLQLVMKCGKGEASDENLDSSNLWKGLQKSTNNKACIDRLGLVADCKGDTGNSAVQGTVEVLEGWLWQIVSM